MPMLACSSFRPLQPALTASEKVHTLPALCNSCTLVSLTRICSRGSDAVMFDDPAMSLLNSLCGAPVKGLHWRGFWNLAVGRCMCS